MASEPKHANFSGESRKANNQYLLILLLFCYNKYFQATTQHVLYAGTQPMHPAGQDGVVVTQPTSAIATTLHGVPATGQQAAFLRPQVTTDSSAAC